MKKISVKRTVIPHQIAAWRSGRLQKMGVSLGWRSGKACGTFMASSPTGAGAGVNCGADTPHETPSRPTHVHVHYARVDPAHRGCSPPLGGGAPGPGRYPRRPWIFVFPGRPSYGRPGHSTVGRPKFGLHRLPLEFLSWSRWLPYILRCGASCGAEGRDGCRFIPVTSL